jgi:tetratricopeptide (TPR) repeat protein
MPDAEAEKLFVSGLKALADNNSLAALAFFEKAVGREDSPAYCSYMALCIAKERGQYQLAVTLCEKAKAREPLNPVHYLNLGKIYLIAGKKSEAIRTFRDGLSREKNPEIIDELNRLGTRKPPVFPFLKRNNPINRFFGLALKKMKLR